jgi:hypothetical protein
MKLSMNKPISRRHFARRMALGVGVASLWSARSYSAIVGANERLRLGVIGCGGMANSHMDALLLIKQTDQVEIAAVCDYVHLNPVRAKLLKSEKRLSDYAWSSYGEYLKSPARRLPWLRVDRLLGERGIPKDSAAGREEFGRQMEQRRREEAAADYRSIRRGWCLGNEEFRQELLAAATERVGPSHYGSDRQETDEQKAERMVRQELQRLGWKEDDLPGRRKGDKEKVKVAGRLRQETTMSLKWIAQRLSMGSWTYVSSLPPFSWTLSTWFFNC